VRTTKDREQDNILSMPGAIVEAGYISNSADRQLLQTADFQEAVASGIFQGILKYAPQIQDIKTQVEAYKADQARIAREKAATPLAQLSQGNGWVGKTLVLIGAAGLIIGLRARARRAKRRPPSMSYGGIKRYR
jgi:hypothetical protein